MITRRQLTKALQRSCANRLTEWHRYRSYGLYRRTDHFVQWIIFDASAFQPAIRAHYSLQALAEQFPAEALTLGDVVRDSNGSELWIRPDIWEFSAVEVTNRIVEQLAPRISQPFTERTIVAFLDRLRTDHVSALTARGIAAVVEGDIPQGRQHLWMAAERYGRIDVEWARVNQRRHQAWLAWSPDSLLSMLCRDAATGASLLGLP